MALAVLAAVMASAPPASAATAIIVNVVTGAEHEGDPGDDQTLSFEISYTGLAGPDTATVTWTTVDGTAVAGSDFVGISGPGNTFLFTAANQGTPVPVSVSIVEDDVAEPIDETFKFKVTDNKGNTVERTATIEDDDDASIDETSVTVTEGDPGDSVTATVNISYDGHPLGAGEEASFDYRTVAGTATAGEDYTTTTGSVTFTSANQGASQAIAVPILDAEDQAEPQETFEFEVLNDAAVDGTLVDEIVITINDDDGTPPALSVADISVVEGNTGSSPTTKANLTVTATESSDFPMSVVLDTASGTATQAVDFKALNGVTVTIAPGTLSKTQQIEIVGDTIDEIDETFPVALSGAVNATILDPDAEVTITDDDPLPLVSISDAGSVTEPDSPDTATLTFDVTLDKPSEKTVRVNAVSVSNTATEGSDFLPVRRTVIFPPGATSRSFGVTVFGDSTFEPDESFFIDLRVPDNVTIDDGQGTGTILNDETLSISIDDVTVDEDAGTADFTVSLNNPSQTETKVDFTTKDGTGTNKATAGEDYTLTAGTLTFTPGDVSEAISVPIIDDTADEDALEVYTVELTNPTGGATIADGVGEGGINDDDVTPTLSIDDPTVDEDAGTMTFTVTLSAPSNEVVTVVAETMDGTAKVADGDYDAKTSSPALRIEPGETTTTFVVTINDDAEREIDETFKVKLSAPTSATIADDEGIGTIDDDDPLSISIGDVTKAEGNVGATTFDFEITLGDHSDSFTIDWTAADGTATFGEDYTPKSGSVLITPGTTSKKISITVNGDFGPEVDETFTVTITAPADVTITDDTGLGTITNDDGPPPAIVIADAAVEEGDSGTPMLVFTVTRTAATPLASHVDYATSDIVGEAVAGTDYTAKSGTATIPANATTTTISIPLTGETIFEDDETFTITLTNPRNATLADDTAIGTIENDDDLPVLSIGDAAITEGDSGTKLLKLPITMTNASENQIEVLATSTDGTAASGSDFVAVSETIVIPPMATASSVDVTVNGEIVFEDDETFTVTLDDPVGATLNVTVGTGTVENDDAMPTISIGDGSTTEGNAGTKLLSLPLTLSNPSQADVSVLVTSSDDTALAGSDYASLSARFTVPGNSTSGSATVTVNGDTTIEPDETLTLTISDPIGATLGTTTSEGTILNDDSEVRSANERYVEWLIVHFLGRSVGPDDPLFEIYTRRLDNGASRSSVVRDLAFSDAYLGAFVEGLYQSTLGRGSDAAGKRYWIDQLKAGMRPADVASLFYAGEEYFRRSGNTNRSWVQDLYLEILLRRADESGLNYWVGLLEAGEQRPNITGAFYYGIESRRTRVTNLYRFLLNRNPDRDGREFWADVLLNGRDVDLAIALAVSPEYYAKAQQRDARDV